MAEYSLDDGKFLVKIARSAISNYLKTNELLKIPKDTPPKMFEKRGVFVTLNIIKGTFVDLRGCIGRPYPDFPLIKATIDSAIDAAVNDPRFSPLSCDELNNIIVEISILTKPELIQVSNPNEYPKKITIGKDGLIISYGWLRGLLLPQVPIEWNWNVEEFLNHLCMKAGLHFGCWREPSVQIYKFNAIIFGEISPNGKIVRDPHLHFQRD